MKRLLPIVLLFLLVSCSYEPSEFPVDPQPYLSVRSLVNEDMWVRMWKDTEPCPAEFLFLQADAKKRWAVDEDAIYHVSVRIVDSYAAIENEGCIERIERISESKDLEILIEHRINSVIVYKDKDAYVYHCGFLD